MYRMATVTLKLSDLELVYVQLNALRRHLGLFPLNPKEYVLSVEGDVPDVASAVALTPVQSSSVALVVPVVVPSSAPVVEEDVVDDEFSTSPSPSSSPIVKPQYISAHSWVSGF